MKHTVVVIAAALAASVPASIDAKNHWNGQVAAPQAGQFGPQVVERYVIDAFGDVDGLVLADGWFVKFPAHQAADLVRTIKPGDVVAVTGALAGERAVEAWTLTNTGSNTMLVRTPKAKGMLRMPKHLRMSMLKQLEARGRITHVMYGKKGEIKSALLDSGTTLRLGKHAQWVIGNRLAVGAEVFARGIGTENAYGRALEVTEIGFGDGPVSSLYRPMN